MAECEQGGNTYLYFQKDITARGECKERRAICKKSAKAQSAEFDPIDLGQPVRAGRKKKMMKKILSNLMEWINTDQR